MTLLYSTVVTYLFIIGNIYCACKVNTLISKIFASKILVCKFCDETFCTLYTKLELTVNLLRVLKYFMCLIFALFGKPKNTLTTKIY